MARTMLNLDVHGNPQEAGIGSTQWLLNVEEHRAESASLRGDRKIPRSRRGYRSPSPGVLLSRGPR